MDHHKVRRCVYTVLGLLVMNNCLFLNQSTTNALVYADIGQLSFRQQQSQSTTTHLLDDDAIEYATFPSPRRLCKQTLNLQITV